MSVGYVALFTCITLLASLLKHEPFKFDIWMDLVGALLCAIATELVPRPGKSCDRVFGSPERQIIPLNLSGEDGA